MFYKENGEFDRAKYKESVRNSMDNMVANIKKNLELLGLAGLIHGDHETYDYWNDLSKEVSKAYERTKTIIDIDLETRELKNAGNDSLGES